MRKGAVCLDGSPAAYYLRQPLTAPPSGAYTTSVPVLPRVVLVLRQAHILYQDDRMSLLTLAGNGTPATLYTAVMQDPETASGPVEHNPRPALCGAFS